jgi:ribokinase
MSIVVIGSYVQDFVWTTAQLPRVGESRIGQFFNGPGGKGFNQAVAAHRQNVPTCFIGAIGNDALAQTARAYAVQFGLNAQWVETNASTAAASVVVDQNGANLICVALGANAKLGEADVSRHEPLIAQARVVVTQLESNLPATACALQLAKTHGVLSILNPAPINDQASIELLALADVLTPNETEFAFLLRHLHGIDLPERWWHLDDTAVHVWCRKLSSNTVVITLGGDGCFVSHAPYRLRGDQQFAYRLGAEQAKAIDTTGAGDAFTGGLAAGLNLFGNESFAQAIRHATRVAALSVEQPGAATAMPTLAQVQARFQ